eukprot:Skav222229  [mRNA]  locus=scaffold2099:94858:95517:+ [translate_table: standard]
MGDREVESPTDVTDVSSGELTPPPTVTEAPTVPVSPTSPAEVPTEVCADLEGAEGSMEVEEGNPQNEEKDKPAGEAEMEEGNQQNEEKHKPAKEKEEQEKKKKDKGG